MQRRWIGFGAAVFVALAVGVVPAAAAPDAQAATVEIHAFCSDEDHTPPYEDPNGGDPVTDARSVIPFGGSIDGLPPGGSFFDVYFEIEVLGPSGELLSYEGPIVDQTLFQGILGINQGGSYQISQFGVFGTTPDGPASFAIPPDRFPGDGVMPVTFDAEQPCDATTVEPGTPAAASPTTGATTTTEATTTSSQPSTSSGPPSTDIEIAIGDEPGESTFRQVFIIPILLGGVLVVVGLVVYYRTRERDKPRVGGGEPPTTGPPPGGEEGTPVSSMVLPPPTADFCDWAAYYDAGGTRHVLREAVGQECCVYVVEMTSRLDALDVTARGRQAPDTLDGIEGAPEDRLRIFDREFRFTGLDLVSWASARSGPFGRLDWMQTGPAANWPRIDASRQPAGDYRPQFRSHEEEPDAAITVYYAETNRLRITLESGCPDYDSIYDAHGTSNADLELNTECTNRDPSPECPVEVDAETGSASDVSGDMTYSVVASTPGDVDELEGAHGLDVREVNGETFYGSHVDSHDHDTRATQTHLRTISGGAGPVILHTDTFSMDVENRTAHDAGVIVPARVWDSTDSVSADVLVEFTHDIAVDAVMQRTTCAAAGASCCGKPECRCAPALRVVFKDGAAHIECDGRTFPLDRNNFGTMLGMAVGADASWAIG